MKEKLIRARGMTLSMKKKERGSTIASGQVRYASEDLAVGWGPKRYGRRLEACEEVKMETTPAEPI